MPEPPAITLPTWDERDEAAAELEADFGGDVDATDTGLAALPPGQPVIECHSPVVMRMLLQRVADEKQIEAYRRTG